MYLCLNCNKLFENPIPIHEYHDELDDNQVEQYYGCPHCRSNDYVETIQCDLCGEYVTDVYVKLKDGTVACSDCYAIYIISD